MSESNPKSDVPLYVLMSDRCVVTGTCVDDVRIDIPDIGMSVADSLERCVDRANALIEKIKRSDAQGVQDHSL